MNPSDSAILSIIEPKYYLGLISDEARWWYFEGHFWGRYGEILNKDQLDLAYEDLLRQRDEQIHAQQLIIRALRHGFTYGASRSRNA